MPPLYESDIVLLESKVMADTLNGGGGPTGRAIAYGGSNGIFRDVTEPDRAGGDVSIRQLHAAIQSPNTEPALGVNIILSQPPSDPNISITLAKCGLFHRRTDIANAIAEYLIQSVEWGGFLLEDHVERQRSINLFHRPGTPAPTPGDTVYLVHNEGLPTQISQYVRVARVEQEERTFTYSTGGSYADYKALVSRCELTDPLRYAFPGSPPSRGFERAANKTRVRVTTVADAAEYYGASPITAVAQMQQRTVQVGSIYSQIVPNSRTETATVDQRPAAARTLTLATSPRAVEVAVAAHTRRIRVTQQNVGFSFVAQLRPLPEAGTIIISYRSMGNWYTLTDDGAGKLTGRGSGQAIYATGSLGVDFDAMPDVGSSIIIQYAERSAYTNRSGQGAQVRQPEYAFTLQQDGAVPGTISMTWPSGGVLRTVTDNGSGQWTGDGTGDIDYPSNGVRLRTPHMIDAGGQFQITYQRAPMHEEIFTGLAVDAAGFTTITTAQQPLAGSVQVQWAIAQEVSHTSGATLTEASSKTDEIHATEQVLGVINTHWVTGDAVGVWEGGTFYGGPVTSAPPGYGSQYGYSTRVKSVTETQSTLQRTTVRDTNSSRRTITINVLTDDGAGGFINGMGAVLYASKTLNVKVVSHDRSTENYKSDYEDARQFKEILTNSTNPTPPGNTTNKGGDYSTTAVGEQMLGSVLVRYQVGPLAPSSVTESYTPPAVVIDLCPYTSDAIVPGSLQFQWMGETYQDFEGRLYRGRTSTTTGFDCGSVNYLSSIALIEDYVVAPGAFVLQSLWTRRTAWKTASVFFRTPAAPVKPTAITVMMVDAEGNAMTATGTLDGQFQGEHMWGVFDYETGVGELQFGDFVLDSSLTEAQKQEWWYRPADVGAVQPLKIWRPWPVDPTSLRINSVTYVYLPLDAELLGLDPVRLPPDGRVPIYRRGKFVVISHSTDIPAAALSAGQTINCARPRLARVHLVGGNGALITSGYSADLDAGMVTINDTTGWVQPVKVRHVIEEMARLQDVQIDGTLTLAKHLSHDYPVGAIVSSAIMADDLQAHLSAQWDQHTWDGITWADNLVGNPASATYNDALAPVEVTNAGALTEKFALRFKNNLEFECIGEHVGNIGVGNVNTDFAPINPISGAPYFVLRAIGWGQGWAAGNVQFLHFVGALYAYAAVRTVQPSTAITLDHHFELLTRVNLDRLPATIS